MGTVTEQSSFSIPKSPSGMFFFEGQGLLYILCGTKTNQEHYLYAYTTGGEQKCLITIPQAVGMSRVDGFYIVGDNAFIVDSQGPIYASESGKLGGSVYQVDWTNPCGCDATGTCTSNDVTWSPTVTKTWSLVANDGSIGDGGGADDDFRNSGIVVLGDYWYGVNGVHPIGNSLTGSYPKSLVKVAMTATEKAAGNAAVTEKWSFDGSTIGHDVDMEGLTCGADACADSIYIGDEYNYIYKLDWTSGEVSMEWDLNSIVGNVPDDKGIESITYASTTGFFYAGIQETATIHVVSLSGAGSSDASDSDEDTGSGGGDDSSVECTATSDYPKCAAPVATSQRVRKELRSLSTAEWDKVVAAMWAMKTETMTSGTTKYGAAFRTYDYFVAKHAVATTDTRGDQAHFGAHFITWHAAFVLEFENALIAIDSSIPGCPYWDQTITSPSVFTADYLGTDPSADTSNQITTGKFANWPVTSDFDIADYAAYIADDSTVAFEGNDGWLRGSANTLTNEFATRYGSGSDFEASAPTADFWWGCTTDESNALWNDWYTCIESNNPSIHSGPHASIGGVSGDNRGDFEDPVTSPNGPIFMFHHANMDRSKMWWMRKHAEEACEYYGFPLTDAEEITPGGGGGMGGMGPPARRSFVGAHLNEVVSSSWGFTAADLGFESSALGTGLLTHADLVCWMGPDTAAYTYDTHADCIGDPSKCHAVQAIATTDDDTIDDDTTDDDTTTVETEDDSSDGDDGTEETTASVPVETTPVTLETFSLQVSSTLTGVTAEQLLANLAGFREAVASLHEGIEASDVVVDEDSIEDVEVRRRLARRLLAAGVAVDYEVTGFAGEAAVTAAKTSQEAAAELETSLKANGFDTLEAVSSTASVLDADGAVVPESSAGRAAWASAWCVVAATLSVALSL